VLHPSRHDSFATAPTGGPETALLSQIHPRPETLRRFLEQAEDRPLVMINLLRFRRRALYPDGFDAEPCSGEEAFRRYGEVAGRKVAEVGGSPVWLGAVSEVVIGEPGERWDRAILVRYPSRRAFQRMIEDPEYQACAVHRTAALEDSRLIATATLDGGFRTSSAGEE
jgi:uncharacterized protein (DUF1330 family)